MSRFFTPSQKVSIYLKSNGKCCRCRCKLIDGWHADHIIPWSKGGPTKVRNGQALCPKCNNKKGDFMFQLREWQEQAYEQFNNQMQQGKNSFFLAACPAAGKTKFSLFLYNELRKRYPDLKFVILAPTTNIVESWEADAEEFFGIIPATSFTNALDTKNGVVATYAKLGQSPADFRVVTRHPYVLILDEIHHLAEEKLWGQRIQSTFQGPEFVIGLSGTPFRTDGETIPFFSDRYEVDDTRETEKYRLKPDFEFNYGEAISSNPQICAVTSFRPYQDSEVEWSQFDKKNGDFEDKKHTFESAKVEKLEDKVMKHFLNPSSPGLKHMLEQANQELTNIRARIPSAGGLILVQGGEDETSNDRHVNAVAKIIKKVSGEDPVVVGSKIPNSSDLINEFKKGSQKWLVTVRMVSEGVDIPRLKVLAYATNYVSPLFFIQALGRVWRIPRGFEKQNAYVFYPKHPTLQKYAQAIESEIDTAMLKKNKKEKKEVEGEAIEGDKAPGDIFINASKGNSGYMIHGIEIPQELYNQVTAVANSKGITKEDALELVAITLGIKIPEKQEGEFIPYRKRAEKLTQRIAKLTKRLAYHELEKRGLSKSAYSQIVAQITNEINSTQGVSSIDDFKNRSDELEKYQERIKIIQSRLK